MIDSVNEEIEKIRARCNAARSGPWASIVEGRDQTTGSSFIMIGEDNKRGEDLYLTGDDQPVPIADYDFVTDMYHTFSAFYRN
jgi:hypothetical protein